MYILKRCWYYITRKKGKSITIGIILFIVSTLVLTGILINTAANNTFKVAKNKLGSNIIYKPDTSSVINNEMNNNGEKFNPENLSLPDDYTDLTTKEIETIKKNSKYVKSYKYNTSYTGNPVDFDEYSLSSNKDDNSEEDFMHDKNDMNINMASLNITGISEESDIKDSSDTLVDGNFFTDEQIKNGDNVIIIEKKLAELNDLKIGDNITIEKVEMKRGKRNNETNDTETNIQVTYTIVGIFETNNSTDLTNNNIKMDMNNSENAMYVPYFSIFKMQENGLTEEEISKLKEIGYKVDSVTFIIDDPENSDLFIKEVENMKDIDLTYRYLSIDNEAYEKMVGNIQSVASTAKILVVVVIISGALIIMLLSMLTIKDRKYEIGVLLSLGESKIKVLFQLIMEIVLIGVISFTLSVFTTSLFAQKVTNYLLNNESSNYEVEKMNNNERRMNKKFDNRSGFNMNRPDTSNMDVETINTLTVSLNPLSVLLLYAIGLFIIILGNSVQTIIILKLNPKEIMLDR